MSELFASLRQLDWRIKLLSFAILIPASIGILAICAVAIATTVSETYWDREFCITNSCIANTISAFDQVFAIANATLQLTVGVATATGIFVALLAYLSTSSNESLSNHLTHIGVFRDYLLAEIQKFPTLSSASFDILFLYNLMFPKSPQGSLSISAAYIEFTNELRRTREIGNTEAAGKPGDFRYTKHQERFINALAGAGVTLSRSTRNGFFEIEDDLCRFFERINRSFTTPGTVPDLPKRAYF